MRKFPEIVYGVVLAATAGAAPSVAAAATTPATSTDGAISSAAPPGPAPAKAIPASVWKAEAELGIILTSGNTKTSSVNAKFKVENERPKWRNHLSVDYLQTTDRSVTTAERSVVAGKSDYKLDAMNYVVGTLRYEKDRFSGFTYRVSESIGYGHRFINSPTVILETEAGVGGRHTKFLDGTHDDEGIIRLAGKYVWKFSPTSEFREEAFTEIGRTNTHTESETSLKVKINAQLAMKLSVLVKHDSTVPVGLVKTDTLSSVNLVYDF